MSEVITYDKTIQADCTVEAVAGINQKGGYVKVMLKIPLVIGNPVASKEMSGELMNHLGNIARVTLEFSSSKAAKAKAAAEEAQPNLEGLKED